MATSKSDKPTRPTLDELYRELNEGPFSILSQKAHDRLILMLQAAHGAGYDHGFQRGTEAAEKSAQRKGANRG